MPNQAIVSGFKGVVDFYLWLGIPVARRWPRSPGPRRAPLVEAQWPAFTTASRLWSLMAPVIQEGYITTSHGSNLTGRDLAMKAYLSGYLNA